MYFTVRRTKRSILGYVHLYTNTARNCDFLVYVMEEGVDASASARAQHCPPLAPPGGGIAAVPAGRTVMLGGVLPGGCPKQVEAQQLPGAERAQGQLAALCPSPGT